jgi:hypothetical protein
MPSRDDEAIQATELPRETHKIIQKEEISEEDITDAEKNGNETANTAINEEEKLKGRAQFP